MLAEIYSKNGENEKINHLKKYAETLNTITKDYIIKKSTHTFYNRLSAIAIISHN